MIWKFACWQHCITLDDMAHAFGIASSKTDDLDGSRVYNLFSLIVIRKSLIIAPATYF